MLCCACNWLLVARPCIVCILAQLANVPATVSHLCPSAMVQRRCRAAGSDNAGSKLTPNDPDPTNAPKMMLKTTVCSVQRKPAKP